MQTPEHQLDALARRVKDGTDKAIARHLDLCAERWIIDLEASAAARILAGEIIELLRPVRVHLPGLTLRLRLIKALERGGGGKNEHGTPCTSNELRKRLASEHSTQESAAVRSSDDQVRVKFFSAREK